MFQWALFNAFVKKSKVYEDDVQGSGKDNYCPVSPKYVGLLFEFNQDQFGGFISSPIYDFERKDDKLKRTRHQTGSEG